MLKSSQFFTEISGNWRWSASPLRVSLGMSVKIIDRGKKTQFKNDFVRDNYSLPKLNKEIA